MLQKVKLYLGLTDSDKDALLTMLLDQAIEEAVAYTHNAEALSLYESAIIRMTAEKYSRLSTEGLQSESYGGSGGVNYSYTSDYPEAVYKTLRAYRKVRTI